MAVILEFRRDGEMTVQREPVDGSLGEIIIFPGVRIDRSGESTAQTAPPPRRSGMRSRRKAGRAR